MRDEFVYTTDDLLRTLDAALGARGREWWNEFFADRAKPCPFFIPWPDENLVEWFDEGLLAPGRVLELGCGNGRNATYLAGLGCRVDAVDFSASAIEWAKDQARSSGAEVAFQCCSIFDAKITASGYDLVYDSGCFHHLPPHRRQDYVQLVHTALRPGGCYGLVCFQPEAGSGYTDKQVYERASLGGGLGYSQDRLRALWERAPFSIRVIRQMKKTGGPGPANQRPPGGERAEHGPCFGEDFLWVLLARKDDSRPA
jgi:SAM-dependent methyltransferase